MPIASGAEGRVHRGTDPGTSWKTKPAANRNCDSYLQRYEELQRRKKLKSALLQGIREKTGPKEESEGANKGSPQEDGSTEDHNSGEPLSGERSKKSRLCVLF